VCADRKRIMVSPFALLAAAPLVAAPLWLRDRVLENVQLAAYDVPPDTGDGEINGDLDDLDDLEDMFRDESRGDPDGTAPASAAAAGRFSRQRMRIAAAAAAVLALLVVAGAVAYWRGDPTPGEPLGLDLPAPPVPASSTGSDPSASGPRSIVSSSALPIIDDDITTTDPGGAGPEDPGVATTTTTRPVDPPPDGPPDPPDPPGDTEKPAIGRAAVSPSDIPCPGSASASASITDNVGVTGATVSWTGPDGSGSAKMSPDGDSWFASVGPFQTSGSVEWTITATDAAGNQTSTGGKNAVGPCPRGE
jgi:hypothetical protein